MKQLFKNLFKSISLLLVIAICLISFTACKKDKNDDSIDTPTTESISDTKDENKDEIIADEVTDEEEKSEENKTEEEKSEENKTEEEKPETDKEEEKPTEETSDYPVIPGLYNHNKEVLTFSDIYFEISEAELFTYFKTRDLNGVYGVVKQLGFDEFVKTITTHTINETSYSKIVSLHKNESDGSELGLANYYIESNNSYIDLHENYIYSIVEEKITDAVNQPKIVVNNNTVSLLYQFTYIDLETNETIYTPLYVKSNLTMFNEIDIMDEASFTRSYQYLDSSAKIISLNGLLNLEEANKKLAEILKTDEDKIISKLQDFDMYFTSDNLMYIVNTEENLLLTEKMSDESTYLLYDTCYIEVVNEYHDLTLNMNVLNIEIEIDENSKFICTFYNED